MSAGTLLGQSPRALAAVFVGGAVGTLLRAVTVTALPSTEGQWPWATFIVNVVGTAILAVVLTATRPQCRQRRLLLGTGLCGGLTTFSTFQVEALELVRGGQGWLAIGYVAASLAAGLLVAQLAVTAVRVLRVEQV